MLGFDVFQDVDVSNIYSVGVNSNNVLMSQGMPTSGMLSFTVEGNPLCLWAHQHISLCFYFCGFLALY